MTHPPDQAEPWIVEQHWDLTYRHAADPVAAAFFRALRDDAKLLGARCPQCERVLVPPRPFCDRDFCETTELVEVATEGTIELFTIIYHRIHGLPDPPYAIAYVRPDGADTALVNFVRGVDFEDREAALAALAIGNRASIRFAEERSGDMTDFHFEVDPGA
jgi:uncharacterized OB-fold protein